MVCGCAGCFWGALVFKKQPVLCFRQKGSAGIYVHAVFRLPLEKERVGSKCPPYFTAAELTHMAVLGRAWQGPISRTDRNLGNGRDSLFASLCGLCIQYSISSAVGYILEFDIWV